MLHLGVGAQMLTSIVNVFLIPGVLHSRVLTIRGLKFGGSHHQGFLQSRGSYNQGSCIQEFISVSHMTGLCIDVDRCSLHSGVQISVSYMTGLCQDVDIDRKILRSGSVLIVNFYIQCVSCAQMLIMT